MTICFKILNKKIDHIMEFLFFFKEQWFHKLKYKKIVIGQEIKPQIFFNQSLRCILIC